MLIAFPAAHGMVLTALYLPATTMLMGLILRGVAFDFRVKAGDSRRGLWNKAFSIGSLVAATATNSLSFVLVGVVITLPAIIIYTFWVYRIFHGKTRALSYGDEGEQ